uniref:Uncharacterized protein n=1 Tax=Panagrolaimus sp. ES5 TaxID=591445 RepID=A0AC34GTQ9_9BILA
MANINKEGVAELKQKLLKLEAFVEHPILSFTEVCTSFRDQYGQNLQDFYEATATCSISQLLRSCSDVVHVSFDEDDRKYTIALTPSAKAQLAR